MVNLTGEVAMGMLADRVDYVIGVDTHRDAHAAAVVTPSGAVEAEASVSADVRGYRRLLGFARERAPGRRVWAIEGTGSFGSGLTTFLLERGEWVAEVDRPARPARRTGAKSDQLDAARAAHLQSQLELLIGELAPALLAEPGVGVITAGQLLNAWSHPGRFRSEAAFASLAGAAPIPASSGQTVRHRLNRSGDRQLNRALHTIVLSRLAHHAETRAYAARRTAEGTTPREIKRCLKRHLARRLYRLLEAAVLSTSNAKKAY